MIRSTQKSERKIQGNLSSISLAAMLLCTVFATQIQAQTPAPVTSAAATAAKKTVSTLVAGPPTRYQPNRLPRREQVFFSAIWGIDELKVRAAESGELIRFSYHILDAEKAKSLNDKNLEPSLIFPEGHVKLVIPSLEKVGQLRQTSTPEDGKSYWMAFSNPGRTVKPGDRIDLVIGQFHATGLIVE